MVKEQIKNDNIEATLTGAVEDVTNPEDMEILYFHLKDDVHDFKLGLNAVLECLAFAEQEHAIPPIDMEWWNHVKRYPV